MNNKNTKKEEKENLWFEETIEEDNKTYILTYDKAISFIPSNFTIESKHLWIESNAYTKSKIIKGYALSNMNLSSTAVPFIGTQSGIFKIEIHKKSSNIAFENHMSKVVESNLEAFYDKDYLSLLGTNQIKQDLRESIKNIGIGVHFLDEYDKDFDGTTFTIYLNQQYEEILNSLKNNILDIVTFRFFIPNLYELKEKKHPFEYLYKFTNGEFNKALITNIVISTNASNKDTYAELNSQSQWLESYERIHPITRKIDNVYFHKFFRNNFIGEIVANIFTTFFFWITEKNDIKAIRGILLIVVILLIYILFK